MKPKRLTPQQLKTQQQLDRISSAFKQAMAAAQYPQAMQEALRAHKLIPQAVAPLSDAATAAVKGSLWHEAITHAKKPCSAKAATSIRSMRWRMLMAVCTIGQTAAPTACKPCSCAIAK